MRSIFHSKLVAQARSSSRLERDLAAAAPGEAKMADNPVQTGWQQYLPLSSPIRVAQEKPSAANSDWVHSH
jgi:hypothetical protein